MTLSNDKVTFPLNRAEVGDDAKQMIDEALAPLMSREQGRVLRDRRPHRLPPASPTYNEKLGEERALAVRNYLHDQHKVALSRIEVISYGEDKPVADNKTKDGPRPEPARGDQGPRVGQAPGSGAAGRA